MHTYRKRDNEWQVGYYRSDDIAFEPRGPLFTIECEAAAYASFLNGGRYCPDEIAHIFAVDVDDEEHKANWPEPEDHTTPPSKGRFSDYPPEQNRKHQEVPTS